MSRRSTNVLKLEKKVKVFENISTRKSRRLFPRSVVGDTTICFGIDDEIAGVDRDSLAVVWRAPINKMRPVSMWNDDLLWVAGISRIGMFDVNTRQLVWSLSTAYGRKLWQDVVVLGDEQGFKFVDPMTGEDQETLDTPGPGPHNPFIVCGDTLVFRESELGDPVRAVSLSQRRVLWERNLLEEMRTQHDVDSHSALLSLTPGSRSDHFIGTRGAATVAFSVEDGHILWKADVTVPYGIPLVIDGRIPILALERFVVIDEVTGEILVDQKHQELYSMAFAKKGSSYGEMVGFGSESGHVALLDMNDGSLVWSAQHRASFYDSAVADGRLLVSGGDGQLWVFSESD